MTSNPPKLQKMIGKGHYTKFNKLCPWMGTIYPRSDHYTSHPEISNKDFYFAVVCYTGGNSSGKLCSRIPASFCPLEYHGIAAVYVKKMVNVKDLPQDGKIYTKHTKMKSCQETHPIRVISRYEMNWADNMARNMKMNCHQQTHPIRVNARYDINWVDIFFRKALETPFGPNIWPSEGRKWH